jgi:hypothetical protein
MPSLACLEQTSPGKWEYYYVLADPSRVYAMEDPAVSQATQDLEAAFIQKEQAGSDLAVGEYLSGKGYVSITGFRIVKE